MKDDYENLIVKRNVGFMKYDFMKSDVFEIAGSYEIELERCNEFGYLFKHGNIKGFLLEEIAQNIRTIIYNRLILKTNCLWNDEKDEVNYFEFSIEQNENTYQFRISFGNTARCGWYNGFMFDKFINDKFTNNANDMRIFSKPHWMGGVLQNHQAYKLMDYLDLTKHI